MMNVRDYNEHSKASTGLCCTSFYSDRLAKNGVGSVNLRHYHNDKKDPKFQSFGLNVEVSSNPPLPEELCHY